MKEPKEKARELVDIFGKEKAILCVDEIIEAKPSRKRIVHTVQGSYNTIQDNDHYWQQVRKEIESYE